MVDKKYVDSARDGKDIIRLTSGKKIIKIVWNIPILKLSKKCDNYFKEVIPLSKLLMKMKKQISKDPKNCKKYCEKVESSKEFNDLAESCLIPNYKILVDSYKYTLAKKNIVKKLLIETKKEYEETIKQLKKEGYKKEANFFIENYKSFKLFSNEKMLEKQYSIIDQKEKEINNLMKDKMKFIKFYYIRFSFGCGELP